jgi:hypothetical protein
MNEYLQHSDYITKRDWFIYKMMNSELDEVAGRLTAVNIAEMFDITRARVYAIYNRVQKFTKK